MNSFDPNSTIVIVIDPQVAFSGPEGTFAKLFGSHDLISIRKTLSRINFFLRSAPHTLQTILVRSEYPIGLHSAEGPLSKLCVPGNGNDCDFSPEFETREDWKIVTKNNTNAWESQQFQQMIFAQIQEGINSIVVTGCLTTTCVKETVLSLISEFNIVGITVVVLEDLIGARESSYIASEGKVSRVEESMEEMRSNGAVILNSSINFNWSDD